MMRFAGPLPGAADFVLLAVFAAGAGGAALGGSNDAADRVEQLFQRLEAQSESSASRPETYVLSEEDLNAFLAFRLRKYNPKGVESVKVVFLQNRMLVRADVDLSKIVSSSKAPETALLAALLTGRHQVEVDGVLEVEDGRGQYRLVGLSLDGVPFPAVLLDSLVDRLIEAAQLSDDPRKPFTMPYGIKDVTITPGRATIRT